MKFLLLILIPFSSFAHDHGGGNASIGKGKGVESYDEHEGFVLAAPAIKRLGIVTSAIGSQKDCNLKSAQVISSLNKKVIYILRNSKFKAVPVSCSETSQGDQVVTKGAEFLRVIEMDLGGGEEDEDEHGHGNVHGDEKNEDHQKNESESKGTVKEEEKHSHEEKGEHHD